MASERCPMCGAEWWQHTYGRLLTCPRPCHHGKDELPSATPPKTLGSAPPVSAKDTRIAELESLLRASEARERELQGKLDAAEAASEKDERDFLTVIDERDAREEVIGEAYQLVMDEWPEWSSDFGFKDALDAMNERLGADMRERENLKSNLDAALAQVMAMKEWIETTAQHPAFCGANWSKVGSYAQDTCTCGKASILNDTSATAQQRVEAIRREAASELMQALCDYGQHQRAIPELGVKGCDYDPEEGIPCTCGLAAILGEKGQG